MMAPTTRAVACAHRRQRREPPVPGAGRLLAAQERACERLTPSPPSAPLERGVDRGLRVLLALPLGFIPPLVSKIDQCGEASARSKAFPLLFIPAPSSCLPLALHPCPFPLLLPHTLHRRLSSLLARKIKAAGKKSANAVSPRAKAKAFFPLLFRSLSFSPAGPKGKK